jgi:uncharacterized protein YbcC (UPF0753/DUF2309 family)
MNQQYIIKSIEQASKVIGKTWPLYSFVTSNPLAGYEDMPFKEAVNTARELLNAETFPETTAYRQAWEQGEIEEAELLSLLQENGLSKSPDFYLDQMESQKGTEGKNINHNLDRIMSKWLAAFLDEGLAEWQMPGKKEGFYKAWRKLAKYDDEIGIKNTHEIPKTSSEALVQILSSYSKEEYLRIFTYHLAALPGWTGYVNYRSESNSLWQQAYPISLQDYLGVRLWVAQRLKAQILPQMESSNTNHNISKLQYIWLKAWEKSWQNQLIKTLKNEISTSTPSSNKQPSPAAQLVFCIDTRSELMRRHVESKGNYETFGYAGFFGIAMDYTNLNDGLSRKSCPPIVSSVYQVSEIPQANKSEKLLAYGKKNEFSKFAEYFLKRMKNMLPSAFGYVEGAGFYYGLSLLARTLAPRYFYRLERKNSSSYETICQPSIDRTYAQADNSPGIPLCEKVAIVKSAFDLMGWKQFAPLVLFVGHGSHSANNPFGSSLDCGACAASPGRHNARMLAKLANQPNVRRALADDHHINIPESTIFLGAEHNTTTDEIVIFDSEVPNSHKEQLLELKSDLLFAQQTATQDRLGIEKNSIALAQNKANNWGETRPEWGLAKNAGFIVAPRALTKNKNLDSQCFLHSYNWKLDESGLGLEGIMQGPMVVTQWINNHYYFATVDNVTFGGGSKITHNITGRFGVVEGNGGDLKMGLPLQSLKQSDDKPYHRPLRLSVLIQAPITRVTKILLRNEHLKTLLDNEWIYLMVMDPLQQNDIKRYQKNMEWIPMTRKPAGEEHFQVNADAEILDVVSA